LSFALDTTATAFVIEPLLAGAAAGAGRATLGLLHQRRGQQ
jgi:hypothetical protein